jgi:peptidoglycan/xylan/chitin deacetylase (PgdA/CDA1 family)
MDGSLVSASVLRRQLQCLHDHYNVISPEQFLRWLEFDEPLPPRSVLLTCDDGLRNTVTDMLPILREFGARYLFFVMAASAREEAATLWYEMLYLWMRAASPSAVLHLPEAGIEHSPVHPAVRRSLWWSVVQKLSRFAEGPRLRLLDVMRKQLSLPTAWQEPCFQDEPMRRRFCLLDREGLLTLQRAGMTIGAHTLSHPMLAQLPVKEEVRREIAESRRVLQEAISAPVWALAYPFGGPGSISPRELALAEETGFRCAFLNAGGGLGAAMPRFALPRVHVTGQMGLAEFEAHVSGFYGSMRRSLRIA